jgi:YD repeat-containing protein
MHILRPIWIVMLLAALVVIGTCIYSNVVLVRSEAYKDSLTWASSAPEIQSALGIGIHAKSPALGYLISLGNSRFAEWSVALVGSRGKGHLYGVANQINGVWEFSRLTFESDARKGRVDITPIRQLLLPRVPTKSVYVVPIGLTASQAVDWAPSYYKARLGVDLTVLPAIPVDPTLIDRTRDQLNADRCIEFLQKKYPQAARDPSAILIGLTSRDMYIPSLGWRYAENYRKEGRYVVISSARLHPPQLLENLNPEWLNSRLQKLMTKNIVMLYFDLPMSSDYTSLLSGGVLSGLEIDEMGGTIIGAEGRWDSFVQSGEPALTIFDVPGKGPVWSRYATAVLPDTSAQVFSVFLGVGLFVQRKTDFAFDDEPALQFSRVYRNQDDRSRAFGIGGSNSFDMFLGGQMGIAVDLILPDGCRIHFVHQLPKAGQQGDIYRIDWGASDRFVGAQAVFLGNTWQVITADGWRYFFPYRPKALPQYVTVLTSFIDPAGGKYEMERDSFGSLLKMTSPQGKWLHFENDSEHRIRKITSSSARSLQYDYDKGGHLLRATDSGGHVDSYTYDENGQMLTAAHGSEKPILTNEYFIDGYIKKQTMSDGRGFGYAYFREGNVMRENQITDPNGLETYIQYVNGGYLQSLPAAPPH